MDFQSKFTINVFLVLQIREEGEEGSTEPRCVDGAAILTIPWAACRVTVTWTRSVCEIKYSLVKSPQRLQPPPINISFRLDFVSQTQWEEIVCHQKRTHVRSHIQSHTHTLLQCNARRGMQRKMSILEFSAVGILYVISFNRQV